MAMEALMPRTVIEPEKARQGRNGPRILIVLVCALLLAMLAWWGVETFGKAIAPDEPVGAAPAQEPASPARASADRQPAGG